MPALVTGAESGYGVKGRSPVEKLLFVAKMDKFGNHKSINKIFSSGF